MKKGFGILLLVLAAVLYVLGLIVLAKEVHYSIAGFWYTVTDKALLTSFLGMALGALLPGVVFNYIGYRLVRNGRSSPP